MKEYVVTVTNHPDGDGFCIAEVTRDGRYIKTLAGRERATLIHDVHQWVAADRAYDRKDVETIKL